MDKNRQSREKRGSAFSKPKNQRFNPLIIND